MGGGRKGMGAMFKLNAAEIHLPQLLNEEAIADEFSKWEQVSSVAAERFAHAPSTSASPGTLLLSRPPSKKRPHSTPAAEPCNYYFFIFTNFV